ncbi:Serine/threonine-protein kinase ULK4 [Trichoplax sp. H2]|nr:Serine/threonine-protein kinase ULK4 [Trichoplax sp. H2]|eukprot:RDD39702.1 Serine/threonine-protein kinase ULK4 [Trichoplax sp. H2]
MENYILYDEIGRGDGSIVYKGRKRGAIEFVAIYCIEKSKRAETTNRVRLSQGLKHRCMVEFHEWYETSKHLWLIVQLCTGGSLQEILNQDGCLPEESIRNFGVDLVIGLYTIHSLGIVFCDLKPSKLLLDGTWAIKYSNFNHARLLGERLDFLDGTDSDSSDEQSDSEEVNVKKVSDKKTGMPFTPYLAPEVMLFGQFSPASDLWSVGCLLYRMYTGNLPFQGETTAELANNILQNDPPFPTSPIHSEEISAEFLDLISGLLRKDPNERYDWSRVCSHEMWKNKIVNQLKEDGLDESRSTLDNSVQSILGGDNNNNSSFLDNSANISQNESVDENSTLYQGSVIRPLTAPEDSRRNKPVCFSLSLRPHSSLNFLTTESEQPNLFTIIEKNDQNILEDVEEEVEQSKGLEETVAQSTDEVSTMQNVVSQSYSDTEVFVSGSSELKQPLVEKVQLPELDDSLDETLPMDTPKGDKRISRKSTPANEEFDQITVPEAISELLYHDSDLVASPILETHRTQRSRSLKWDAKSLSFPSHTAEQIVELTDEEQQSHLQLIQETLQSSGSNMQRIKLHAITYLTSISSNSSIADLVFHSDLLIALAIILKSPAILEIKEKIAKCFGLIISSATMIKREFNISELFGMATDALRDSIRNVKLKQTLTAALGELIYFVASQEMKSNSVISNWEIPSASYVMIVKCLQGGDPIVQQHAAKTIESVAVIDSRPSKKLATPGTAQALWNLFTHSSSDALCATAISALSRLNRKSSSIFNHIYDRVGLQTILKSLSTNVGKISQSLITMLISTLFSGQLFVKRMVQDKQLVTTLIHLLENSSYVIRGKAYLAISQLIKLSQDAALTCCQARLLVFIERDNKIQPHSKDELHDQQQYALKCLKCVVDVYLEAVPNIFGNPKMKLLLVHLLTCNYSVNMLLLDESDGVLRILEVVSGRRHPSSSQIKQLKSNLPYLSVIHHLLTNQIFRSRLTDDVFLTKLKALLSHVISVDEGTTSLSSTSAPTANDDFKHIVLSMVLTICQQSTLVMKHYAQMVKSIMPSLIKLIESSNGDTRVLCLRVITEVGIQYLNQWNDTDVSKEYGIIDRELLQKLIILELLPSYEAILKDQDPIPTYAVKLLAVLIQKYPSTSKFVDQHHVMVPLLHVYEAHKDNISQNMRDNIVDIFYHCLPMNQETFDILIKNADEIIRDDEVKMATLSHALDIMYHELKYVSGKVRVALQTKEKEKNSDCLNTERLLIANRPAVKLIKPLIYELTRNSDNINERALRCLSLAMQLIGGEFQETLSANDIDFLIKAVKVSTKKYYKNLFRIIKRFVTTNSNNTNSIRLYGGELITTLKAIKSIENEAPVIATINDILSHIDESS